MSVLSPDQTKVLNAAADRIIPADDYPGAVEAGATAYIERQLAGDLAGTADSFRAGLDSIELEAQLAFDGPFAGLSADEQDSLLRRIEVGDTGSRWPIDSAAFFTHLVDVVMEGYYADSGNGGNRGEVSWRMIGFVVTDRDQPTVERRP